MNHPDFIITEISPSDKPAIAKLISESWGSTISISRGRKHEITELPGFICKLNNIIAGLITYHIENEECEIATLNCTVEGKGLGTRLIQKVMDKAREQKCTRVWLITSNDNTKAIRFYQRRGFEWVGFHKDAMIKSRKLKPEIPETGNDNIPIKHEIEFEIRIDS